MGTTFSCCSGRGAPGHPPSTTSTATTTAPAKDDLLFGLTAAFLSSALSSLHPSDFPAQHGGAAYVTGATVVPGSENRFPTSHSGLLRLDVNDDCDAPLLFLKRVTARAMAHKTWFDRRKTLVYARTELRFYTEFAPALVKAGGVRLPRLAAAESRLENALGDTEVAARPGEEEAGRGAYAEPSEALLADCGAMLLLEAVSSTAMGGAEAAAVEKADEAEKAEKAENVVRRVSSPAGSSRGLLPNKTITNAFETHGDSTPVRLYPIGDAFDSHPPTGRLTTRRSIHPSAGTTYTQCSPISEAQAVMAVGAAARLHAAGWEQGEAGGLLARAAKRLQRHGGAFSLSIRSPAELKKLRGNWARFVSMFAYLNPPLFNRPGIVNLGERLEAWSGWVSRQLSPPPEGKRATLIHGDFKAMNVFFPVAQPTSSEEKSEKKSEKKGENKSEALLIDFASTGVGIGMADVGMLLSHSVAPETLKVRRAYAVWVVHVWCVCVLEYMYCVRITYSIYLLLLVLY